MNEAPNFESTPGKTFVKKTIATMGPPKDFDAVSPLVVEDKQVP
jgi:hypothetical protein